MNLQGTSVTLVNGNWEGLFHEKWAMRIRNALCENLMPVVICRELPIWVRINDKRQTFRSHDLPNAAKPQRKSDVELNHGKECGYRQVFYFTAKT